MSRPIDADALFRGLLNTDPKTKGSFCDGVAKAMEFIINAPTIEAEPVRHGCPYCCDNGEGGHGRLKCSYDDHDGMTMSINPSEKRKDGTRSLAWWATVHFREECRDFYIEVCPFCGRRLVPLKEEHDCTSPNCGTRMDIEYVPVDLG